MPTMSLPLAVTKPVTAPAAVVKTDLDQAVESLSRDLSLLCLHRLYEAETPQQQATCLLALSRAIPALKVLNNRIQELDPGPMEGYALIDQAKGADTVAVTKDGAAIFETEEAAFDALESWFKETPIDPRIGVRRVRVSIDKGVEMLDWVV